MSLFPVMAVQESWSGTMDAVRKIEKESVEFVFNLFFLALFFLVAAVSYAALDAAVSAEKPPKSPPAVQEKASYIFLRNMPWVVGNVQSFFSSAVVFPDDANPEDLAGDGEDALSLNESDKRFYRAVYRPLLADLARCGTPEKKVTIELSGFASSSNISSGNQQEKKIRGKCSELNTRLSHPADSGKPPDINEVFNLCVAKRRSKFVKEMLEGFVKEEKSQGIFKFQVKQWGSLEQMKAQTNKIFYDVTGQSDENPVRAGQDNEQQTKTSRDKGKSGQHEGNYDRTRGLMNRRVDVAIIDTPLCMM